MGALDSGIVGRLETRRMVKPRVRQYENDTAPATQYPHGRHDWIESFHISHGVKRVSHIVDRVSRNVFLNCVSNLTQFYQQKKPTESYHEGIVIRNHCF